MINVRMQDQKQTNGSPDGLSPKITVLGVGGAGGNAVNNMIDSGLQGCEFVVCNTDAQALKGSRAETQVQLGASVTGGLGAGAKPEIGKAAAEETLDDVLRHLEGANMAFITAGMGGGTGTGAAPVIAKACREKGILTVGVVTKPFHFEGTHRMKMAEDGIQQMQDYVDTLIVIPNQNLFRVANEKTTFAEAFKMADTVLQSGVRGVTDLMVMPGLINLDFADIRSAMLEMGKAMMGTGEASSERRAIEAAEAAINNPLLDDVSMKGARGVIINVTGGFDMTLFEVDEACNRIRDEVDPNANIIFGSTFDESLDGLMRVSVVATGIDAEEMKQSRPVQGYSAVNAMTAQQHSERKLDRVQPNTAPDNRQEAAVSPSSAASSVMPKFRAPAAPAAPMAPSAKTEEPEADMFEQQEFAGNKEQSVSSSDTSSFATGQPYGSKGGSAPQASIYQNSFIPPQPVEVEKEEAPQLSMTQPVASSASAQEAGPSLQQAEPVHAATENKMDTAPPLTASRPAQTEEQPVISSPSLTLRPPVPGANAQHRKRAPSLFERFTSPLRHGHDDNAEKTDDTGSATGTASGASGGGFAPQQRQGMLNIDTAPKTEAVAEDELDIPAFLRRQAN